MRTNGKPTLIGSSALVFAVSATPSVHAKDLIEYFQATPIVGTLSSSAWGAAATGPRDQSNGLEDSTIKNYQYWDGQILKGPDGKYHMFASRWAQTKGMSGWGGSIAVHAVSNSLIGPYVDQGQAYTDSNGKGHNVTASLLPDGRYTIIVSDTRPGDIFLSSSVNGPWAFQGSITVDANGFDASGTTKNLSLTILADKSYLMATRFGAIMTTPSNLLGPWKVQGPRVFTSPAGYPSGSREDPVIWCSGGQFHLVYNYYDLRKARHMTSPDGIRNWKDVGLAYDPTADFVRYTDGTVNHWRKMERAGVYMENGHVRAFTFAVIDVDKTLDLANDTHGTKVIVVPFDGVTFDADTGVPGNACSTYSMNSGVPSANGGAAGTGGATSVGGTTSAGGTKSTGGASAAGGTKSTGGASAAGGVTSAGGTKSTGGVTGLVATSTGGTKSSNAGASAIGGAVAGGGTKATGGTSNLIATGGAMASTGGAVSVGGSNATGGALAAGGAGEAGSPPVTGGANNNGTTATTSVLVATGGTSSVNGGLGGNTEVSGTSQPPGDSGSCSCKTVGTASGQNSGLLPILGAVGLALSRRRRR